MPEHPLKKKKKKETNLQHQLFPDEVRYEVITFSFQHLYSISKVDLSFILTNSNKISSQPSVSLYLASNSGCTALKNTIQSKAKQLQMITDDILKFITSYNRYPHALVIVRLHIQVQVSQETTQSLQRTTRPLSGVILLCSHRVKAVTSF